VLAVIYLLFNEAYLSGAGDRSYDRDLADDAEFLAALLHRLMPTEPEVAGLLALIGCTRRASPPGLTTAAASFNCPIRTVAGGTTPRSRTLAS